MRFTVVLLVEPEEGGYTALVPALPGCVSYGDSVDEALAMIRDAAEGYLAVAAERGEEILEEAFGTVVAEIEVPAPVSVAVA
jgi:predicted RNase H-like HicB family nuclease